MHAAKWDASIPLDGGVLQMKKAQTEDPSLRDIRRKCDAHEGTYIKQKGLIYRSTRVPNREAETHQLILPAPYREVVPLAAHFGRNKTTEYILRPFTWPGLRHDVAEMYKRCQTCQKTARGSFQKAKLVPLPVIEVPFTRIAMDMVGPLPRTEDGHRYILTIVDYGSRYPDAIPLRTTSSQDVAEALLEYFSRVGLPKEILTDRGSNFTSDLMDKLYQMLGIHGIRTSAYHPQTDGMVERYNATLKSCLRKYVYASMSTQVCLRKYVYASMSTQVCLRKYVYASMSTQVCLRKYVYASMSTQVCLRKYVYASMSTQVCLRKYVYASMSTQVCLRKYVYASMSTQVCLRKYVYASMSTHVYASMSTQVCLRKYVYASMSTQVCLRKYVYASMSTQVCLRKYVYASMSTQVCLRKYVYASMSTQVCLRKYVYASMSTQVCLRKYAYASMPTQVCLRKYVYATMSTQVCLRKYVYATMSTQVCLRNYVYASMSTQVCLRKYVYATMSTQVCLRKYVDKFPQEWNKSIPFVLFACRSVIQQSTGFSPFEIFARQPRGPLDVLKEEWEEPTETKESVVSYLRQTYDRLEEVREIAITMETKAKHEMETWYNKKARDRVFTIGDLVLVMLPSSTNKRLAKWMGPCTVEEVLSNTTYKIAIPHARKNHRTFHVNMLLKWESPSAVCLLSTEETEKITDNTGPEFPLWKMENTGDRHGREAEPREEGRH